MNTAMYWLNSLISGSLDDIENLSNYSRRISHDKNVFSYGIIYIRLHADVFDVSESVSALIREHEKVQKREGEFEEKRKQEKISEFEAKIPKYQPVFK